MASNTDVKVEWHKCMQYSDMTMTCVRRPDVEHPEIFACPMQHLMALPMPVPVAPPPAAEPDQACSQACEPLHMAALSSEAPLQPAKLAVWKLFMEQVRITRVMSNLSS